MKIYFLRHGETDWNKNGMMQGHSDIPLNENGIAQANSIAEFMHGKQFNIVYVSPLKRALDTAKIVVKAKANLIVLDHRLKERGYGEFEGSPYEQYRELIKENEDFIPKGGESRVEFRKRIKEFFENLDEKHEDILIVAHGGVFNAVLKILFNLETEEARKYRLGNCEHCIIEKTDKFVMLIKDQKIVLQKEISN